MFKKIQYLTLAMAIFINLSYSDQNVSGKIVSSQDMSVISKESESRIKKILMDKSMKILKTLKENNMTALSKFIHPKKGVRFSPYSFVLNDDITFKPNELIDAMDKNLVYFWGLYDGTGDDITLSFKDYFKKFVYDADFLNAEKVSYNKIIRHGNTLINIQEMYPKGRFVEYHFSGFDPKLEGMDWTSLRLVFEKYRNKWVLVGLVHGRWTI